MKHRYKIRIVIAALVAVFAVGLGIAIIAHAENAPPHIDPETVYRVAAVVDGDTIKTVVGHAVVTVRLLGINTPETVDPRKAPECYGREASEAAKSLLAGRSVRLILNPHREEKDKYNRYLAYVYRDDGLFVNEYLLEHGFAREYTVGRPYDFQSEFRAIESRAKEQGAGLWSACPSLSGNQKKYI